MPPALIALSMAACSAPPTLRCPEAPSVAAATPSPPAPVTSSTPEEPANEALSHCATVDQGNVERELLERPVPLRAGVGSVWFQVTTRSKEAQAFFNQGLAYLHSYFWIEASRSFHEALRRDPALAMACWGLARAEIGMAERHRAHEALAHARALAAQASPRERLYIDLLAQQIEAMFSLGAVKKKRHEAYKADIEKAIAQEPSDPELWVLRGNAEEPDPGGRGQQGKIGAAAFYEAALARDPRHVGAHHYLVHAFENVGRYAEALAHARTYAADAAAVPHAQHMLGHVLPRAGTSAEALVQLEKAEALHDAYERAERVRPGDDWHRAHNLDLLGTLYLRFGRFSDAEKAFRRAYAIPVSNPIWEGNHASLPEFLLLRGRSEEALDLGGKMAAGVGSGPIVGEAIEVEALLLLGKLDEARAAAWRCEDALTEQRSAKTRDAERMVVAFEDYAKQARALVDLHGAEADKAGETLLAMIDELVESPSYDAWGIGLFLIERFAAEAKRAGRDALAAELRAKLVKLDPSYVPGASIAQPRGASSSAR